MKISLSLILLCCSALSAQAQDIKDSLDLQGVEVVAQKPVVKMTTDKMTYNVQQDADAKTMTLLDMLRKVPMVTVDGQDKVTVKGSSNFKVYVDGKPNQMFQSNLSQVAKSVPASMVQSVEVITSPGAKYDAEGTMGVLDIKMVHNTGKGSTECDNCYNGNVELTVANHGFGANTYVGGQQGKLTYSVNGFTNYQYIKDFQLTTTREQNTTEGLSKQTNSMNYTMKQPYSMGNLTLGYAIDSMRSIDVNVGVSGGNENFSNNPTNTFEGGIYGNGFSYQYGLSQHNRFMGVNASADYQRWLNADHTSSFTLSYLYDYNPARNRTRTTYGDVANVTGLTLSDLYSDAQTWGTSHTAQADFTFDLGKGQTLETGAKFIHRNNKSDSKLYDIVNDEDVLNADNSINYRNLQSIVAGYAQYKLTKEKYNARFGLRYEHTFESVKYKNLSDRNFHKDYGNLVPSGSVGVNLTQTSNLGLTYTMRISRPDISQLNPYTDRTDPVALSYGNPSLAVMKSHDVSLAYNFFSPKLMFNIGLSEDYCGNEVENYAFVDSDHKYNSTYANNGKSSVTSLNTFVRTVLSKTTTVMLNGSVGYGDWKAKELGYHNYGWTGNAYLGLEQQLPWKIKSTAGIFAKSRDYNLMGYTSAMQFFSISLTRTFLKDHLELSARYVNPFGNRLVINQYSAGNDFSSRTHISFPLQMGMLSVKWNFGNTKKQFGQHESKINNDFNDSQKKDSPVSGMGTGNM
ncbi:MAG: TonB-dependent receptor domain-containing protein [Prevotella sp.]